MPEPALVVIEEDDRRERVVHHQLDMTAERVEHRRQRSSLRDALEEALLGRDDELRALAIVDVGRLAIPLLQTSVLAEQGDGAEQEPAVSPVRPPQARLRLHARACGGARARGNAHGKRAADRRREALLEGGEIVRMKDRVPAPVTRRVPGVLAPASVEGLDASVRERAPHQARDRIEDELQLVADRSRPLEIDEAAALGHVAEEPEVSAKDRVHDDRDVVALEDASVAKRDLVGHRGDATFDPLRQERAIALRIRHQRRHRDGGDGAVRADDVARGDAEQLAEGVVDHRDVARLILDQDAETDAAHQRVEPLRLQTKPRIDRHSVAQHPVAASAAASRLATASARRAHPTERVAVSRPRSSPR